jgi:hypothetical protein
MNKKCRLFAKAILLLLVLYIWPSCQKKDNDPPPPPTGNDSTGNGNDTTKKPNDTIILKGWVVSTFAGSNVSGYVDGSGTQARFLGPVDITQDVTGDLYVAETKDIRKITPAGQVSTYIKEDSSVGALIKNLGFFLSDGYGRFYYTLNNNHVRTLTVTGGSVFAGSTTSSGSADGQGTDARFNNAMSIARDGKGNLYVPDRNLQNKFVIRKITPSGYVSTVALNDQTGISSDAVSGTGPYYAFAADSTGNIYFTAGSYMVIKKADPQGNVTVLAGSTTTGFKDGKGQDAQFNGIVDLDVDSTGNVWVCDMRNNAIRKVASDGTVTTIAGNGTAGYVNGEGAKARFNFPWGITINKNGTMYVVEANNHAVRKIEYRQ